MVNTRTVLDDLVLDKEQLTTRPLAPDEPIRIYEYNDETSPDIQHLYAFDGNLTRLCIFLEVSEDTDRNGKTAVRISRITMDVSGKCYIQDAQRLHMDLSGLHKVSLNEGGSAPAARESLLDRIPGLGGIRALVRSALDLRRGPKK